MRLRCESTTNSGDYAGAGLLRDDFVGIANGFVHQNVIEGRQSNRNACATHKGH
jgi:hypothetical protein